MTKIYRPPDRPLTEKQLRFIAVYDGDATAAARKVGYKQAKNAGWYLMKNPRIKAAIDRRNTVAIEEMGKQMAQQISIGPVEVINRLADVVRLQEVDDKGITANLRPIVAAGVALLDVFGLRSKANANNIFDGWTPQERIAYADRGKTPDRLASATGIPR